MLRLMVSLLFLFASYIPSQEKLLLRTGALDAFIHFSKEILKSSQDTDELLLQGDKLASGDIRDTSEYRFEDYLEKINELREISVSISLPEKSYGRQGEVIYNELYFRTLTAAQFNLERLYWNMPDHEKFTNALLFATTGREMSLKKTELLRKQFTLLNASDEKTFRLRTWLAVSRMLNDIDIPKSESGSQFVQRSPYGIIIRRGELSGKIRELAESENDSEVKNFAIRNVEAILSSPPKYKDPGRAIVIGKGPEVINLISKEALIYFNSAMESNSHSEKIALYTKAIRTDSVFPAAYYNRGVSYFEMKEYPAALSDFIESLKLDSNNTDVYSRLGDTYMQMEHYNQAVKNYTKALSYLPEEPSLYISRGISFERLREYESAIRDYTKAINLDTSSVSAYNNRAQCYVSLKDYNRAIADYNTLIRLRPDNSTYYFNLGCIYWEHKNWDKVKEVWQKGLTVNPEDQNILKNLPRVEAGVK